MTAFTLVIIFYLGSYAGQNIVVSGFPTREVCQEAGNSISAPRHSLVAGPIIRCFEVLR
jgi:hypothetical protein